MRKILHKEVILETAGNLEDGCGLAHAWLVLGLLALMFKKCILRGIVRYSTVGPRSWNYLVCDNEMLSLKRIMEVVVAKCCHGDQWSFKTLLLDVNWVCGRMHKFG